MPHFGLMSTEESFRTPEGALQRARLHIRAARRRLREGKISAGIVTLYDALIFGLRWYFTAPEHRDRPGTHEMPDLMDERSMLGILGKSGTIKTSFDLDSFEQLVDRASDEDMPDYDYRPMLFGFESLMTGLGVMPFEEEKLPPEDPSTF